MITQTFRYKYGIKNKFVLLRTVTKTYDEGTQKNNLNKHEKQNFEPPHVISKNVAF